MEEQPVKQAFGSPGGKSYLAPKIVGMIPPHETYVEPFAGGAAVYFKKVPSKREVLSDKDREIAFAFRFLRDMTPEQFERLKGFDWCITARRFEKIKGLEPRNDLERFYKFYYVKKASFGSGGNSVSPFRVRERSSVGVDHLWKVHERLRRTHIHGNDALAIIRKYDSPSVFFYIDPPYPERAFIGAEEKYTADDLMKLLKTLRNIKGKFLLSLSTEHLRYLPSSWHVKRLKLRRNIPREGEEWNRSFHYEIVAANYQLDGRGTWPKVMTTRRRLRKRHHPGPVFTQLGSAR